jgi:zinc protease
VLTKTKDAELGYAIDSVVYGIPDYNTYVRTEVASLTRDQVNAAIRKHLRADRVQIVAIGRDMDALKNQLTGETPTAISYNSSKPDDILSEDKTVEKWNLNLRPQDVQIVMSDHVLE